jgi:hypothetical protein
MFHKDELQYSHGHKNGVNNAFSLLRVEDSGLMEYYAVLTGE